MTRPDRYPRSIRLSSEWGCHPLWFDFGGPDPRENIPFDELSTLGPGRGLISRIGVWDARYQAVYDRSDPRNSGFVSSNRTDAWVSEGRRLARWLRASLPPEITVEFHAAGQRVYVVSPPPENKESSSYSEAAGCRDESHWPRTVEDAERVEREVAGQVAIPSEPVPPPRIVAGLDVSYATDSTRIAAAAVLVDVTTRAVVEEAVVEGVAAFDYHPGLLAFREVPILLEVLERVRGSPDLLLCDGHGLAHPRRCGLACHLGVLTGIAAIGCAKTHFVGEHAKPGPDRGQCSPLVDAGEVVGQVLRTQDRVRPVYVSPGHAIGIAQSSDIVLSLCSRYRLPDPIRRADHISRHALQRAL